MPLVKHDRFLSDLLLARSAWIGGLQGGGKTLAAIAIADELYRRRMVKGVVANFEHDLPLPDWRETMMYETCAIIDEAHLLIDSRTASSNDKRIGAFARKTGVVWLYPSVYPVDVRQRVLKVFRTGRLMIPGLRGLVQLLRRIPIINWLVRLTPLDWYGSEIWVYKYDLNVGYMDSSGVFWIVRPEEYFGRYNTKYVPVDDAGILELYNVTYEHAVGQGTVGGGWYVREEELTRAEREDLGLIAERFEEGADRDSGARWPGTIASIFASSASSVRASEGEMGRSGDSWHERE